MTNELDNDRTATLLPLEGGLNFRDLGGYVGANGRRVRRGKVYRSGSMHSLTPADQNRLATLGIRVVFDLRSNHERLQYPLATSDEWAPVHWSRDYAHGTGDLESLKERADFGAEIVKQRMVELYREIPYDHSDSYRELFQQLEDDKLPLVFNCAAGKDRTGVAGILVHDLLGVSKTDIVADYLASNRVADKSWDKLSARNIFEGPSELWAPIFTVDEAYVDSLYDTLEKAHGSLAGYRREVLGMNDAAENTIRERLLEPKST